MKRYLIDESTFKKFVAKVKASADGEKVTAVVNQPKNERFENVLVILLWILKWIFGNMQHQKTKIHQTPTEISPRRPQTSQINSENFEAEENYKTGTRTWVGRRTPSRVRRRTNTITRSFAKKISFPITSKLRLLQRILELLTNGKILKIRFLLVVTLQLYWIK